MFKKVDTAIRDWNHRRIDVLRDLKIGIAKAIFPLFSTRMKQENRGGDIVVFRLDDKIGDSITATGFLHELSRNFPANRLVVFSGRNAAFIYKNLPFVNEVRILKKGLFNTFWVYLEFRGRKLRYLFNTSHILTPQVIFLSSFLSAWKKLTFLNSGARSFTDHVCYDPYQEHVTERYRKSLQAVGIENVNLDYRILMESTKETKAAEKALIEFRRKTLQVIVLNSFAGARLRNLNQKTTTEIVDGLLEKYANATIVSVGSQDDLAVAQKWVQEFKNPRWVCFPRQGSLAFNLAIAQNSSLVITPDTSWVHIASAMKKPVVAIYRQDEALEKNSLIWAPYGTKNKVVYAPADPSRPDDINSVNPQEVIEKAEELLADVN